VRLGPKAARAIGLAWPVMREGAEMLYQFRQPHSVDATAYLTSIGPGRITSYEQGIEQTLKWYLGNRTRSVVTMGR
jgi:dTDP-D-glucose 4,6-dehydratase